MYSYATALQTDAIFHSKPIIPYCISKVLLLYPVTTLCNISYNCYIINRSTAPILPYSLLSAPSLTTCRPLFCYFYSLHFYYHYFTFIAISYNSSPLFLFFYFYYSALLLCIQCLTTGDLSKFE